MNRTNESPVLMAVHAHPDDEVVSTGGALAHYAARGARVVLVCATRGEVGEIVDPSIGEEARPRLAEIREAELRCSCQTLGIQELVILGYRDSGMAGTADNDNPHAFCRADMDEAVGRLVRAVRAERPQVMVTYDEKGGYGHPDHVMAHRVAVAAFEAAGDPSRYPNEGAPWRPSKMYYAAFPQSQLVAIDRYLKSIGTPSPFDREDISPEQMGTPDELVTTKLDVRGFLPQIKEALRCHRSQIAADSFFFSIPDEMASQGLGYEYFVRAQSLVDAPTPEDDLFAGLGT